MLDKTAFKLKPQEPQELNDTTDGQKITEQWIFHHSIYHELV
jgi:hypothetical protein